MSFGICVTAPALSKYEYTFYKKLGQTDYWFVFVEFINILAGYKIIAIRNELLFPLFRFIIIDLKFLYKLNINS